MWAKSLDSGPWAPWTARWGLQKVLECECGVRPAPYVEAEDLVGKVRDEMNLF